MVGQHSPMTLYSLVAKAGLWAWLWSVRASIGDPGDGSFGWVGPRWDGVALQIPMINLGWLPWEFELRVTSASGVVWVDPKDQTVHRAIIPPRSVRWARMQPVGRVPPDERLRFELCTSPRLDWLRATECHRFDWEMGRGA